MPRMSVQDKSSIVHKDMKEEAAAQIQLKLKKMDSEEEEEEESGE